MWISMPDEVPNVLWEGPLQLDDHKEVTSERRDGDSRVSDLQDLPVVSIGRPEIWSLTDLFSSVEVPGALSAKLEDADFYVVRLSCSFRPSQLQRIVWARYVAHFHGDSPIALDLYPLSVTKEIQRGVKVVIDPSLKFLDSGARLGQVVFGTEYKEIVPLVSAAGAGESRPSWDYEAAKSNVVQGSKFMHVLLQTLKGSSVLELALSLVAEVRTRNSIVRCLAFRDQEDTQRRVRVRLRPKQP